MASGILLINLGTPSAPTETAVRAYLNEFLSDPYVITLPAWVRYLLVQKIILKKRPQKTAKLYEKIWTPLGSPLLVNSIALKEALQKKLSDNFKVALGMRYGEPSIISALKQLQDCKKIVVLPLFPQFSNATTQSALDAVDRAINENKIKAEITIIRDFYAQDFYIQAMVNQIKNNFNPDREFLLLSYHSLPINHKDADIYRAQCMATSAAITKALQLSNNQYLTSFQSRLGFTKWITPYTDRALKTLREKNIENMVVACPSFVAA